jgi:hypothetical protein
MQSNPADAGCHVAHDSVNESSCCECADIVAPAAGHAQQILQTKGRPA